MFPMISPVSRHNGPRSCNRNRKGTTLVKNLSLTSLLSTGLLLAAGPLAAQDTGWEFTITPYAWLPGLSTSVDTRFGTVDSDTSGSDALSDLDFAFMGSAEARKGRWGAIVDVIYSDLSQTEDTPFGRLFSSAKVDTKVMALSGYAAFRAYETDRFKLDLLGGFRYYDAKVDVSFAPGRLPGESRELSESWTDPVFGARGSFAFTDKWVGTAAFDFGGFDGSNDSTWQALATVAYRFNDNWSVLGGWRYLDIQKEIDGRDLQVQLNGPAIGVSYRF